MATLRIGEDYVTFSFEGITYTGYVSVLDLKNQQIYKVTAMREDSTETIFFRICSGRESWKGENISDELAGIIGKEIEKIKAGALHAN